MFVSNKLVICFVSGILVSASSFALDFMSIYESAKQLDPALQMAQQNYLAEQQDSELGSALLKPSINAHGRIGRSYYKSDAPQFVVDDVEGALRCKPLRLEGVGSVTEDLSSLSDCYNALANHVRVDNDVSRQYTASEVGVTLTQPLYDKERWHQNKIAQMSSSKSGLLYLQAEAQVIYNVAEAYITAVQAADSIAVGQAEAKTITRQLKFLRAQLDNGIGKASDVYAMSSSEHIKQSQMAILQGGLDAALSQLSSLVGRPVSESELRRFKRDIPVTTIRPQGKAAWIALAQQHNTQLRKAGIELQIAQQQYYMRKGDWLPKVNFVAVYNKIDTAGGQGFIPGAETGAFGVDVRMPIYNGGAISAGKTKAYHQVEAAKHRVRLQQQQLESAIGVLYAQLEANIQAFDAYQQSFEKALKSQLNLRKEASKGLASAPEVLANLQKVHQVKAQLDSARFEYLLNKLKLRQLVGVLTERDLEQLNRLL